MVLVVSLAAKVLYFSFSAKKNSGKLFVESQICIIFASAYPNLTKQL